MRYVILMILKSVYNIYYYYSVNAENDGLYVFHSLVY